MKEGLNLLPSVAKFQAAKIKLKKKINLGMAVFLTVWILLMAVVFGWLGFSNYLLGKANKDNTAALNQYKSLATNVVLSKRNKYQAKLVGKVLKERFEYGASIDKITKLFSEGVSVDNFEIKNRRQFLLKGSLMSGKNMAEVEGKVKDINSGLITGFKSANVTDIIVDSNGWRFEMEINLI